MTRITDGSGDCRNDPLGEFVLSTAEVVVMLNLWRAVQSVKAEKQQIAYMRFETDPGFQAQVDCRKL